MVQNEDEVCSGSLPLHLVQGTLLFYLPDLWRVDEHSTGSVTHDAHMMPDLYQ